jgi:hypothetical protein
MSSAPPASAPRTRVFAPTLLLLLGIFGMSAIWTLIALIVDTQCAWIAAIAAADFALLLRLAHAAPGRGRALAAVVATLATILIANWTIAATQMGGPMGLELLDSVQRLGTDHAQTLLGLANRPAEWAWYAIAVVLALWLGR